MWQEALQPRVEAGELVVIGVMQEQHPARARLYRQWRRLEWPLFLDPLNELGHEVVPIPMALDENGVVVHGRLRRPEQLADFLAAAPAGGNAPKPPVPHPLPGDAHFHAGDLDSAVKAYRAAPEKDAIARFRLGVALRRRFEGDGARPGDAQAAVDAWTEALAMEPGQYIWRRRIQQYGPSLDKPYNMFGWVERARAEIRARGEEPVPLDVEPRGTEIMGREAPSTQRMPDPDPEGAAPRDEDGLVRVESFVAPGRVRPGHRARVRLVMKLRDAYWNNEAEPLQLHADPPAEWAVAGGEFVHGAPEEAETQETRILEVELAVPADATAGRHELSGYLVYNVCKEREGVCLYLRQDFRVPVIVDPDAPEIQ